MVIIMNYEVSKLSDDILYLKLIYAGDGDGAVIKQEIETKLKTMKKPFAFVLDLIEFDKGAMTIPDSEVGSFVEVSNMLNAHDKVGSAWICNKNSINIRMFNFLEKEHHLDYKNVKITPNLQTAIKEVKAMLKDV